MNDIPTEYNVDSEPISSKIDFTEINSNHYNDGLPMDIVPDDFSLLPKNVKFFAD